MQFSFFDIDDCYSRLDSSGDPLVRLNSFIDWAGLSSVISSLGHESGGAKSKGGRPGFDPLLIVKCLILQSLYNLSDDSLEYQINDRLSFKRFLGLDVIQKSPDAKTFWHYRERIKHKNLEEKIFLWFESCLENAGYKAESGQIVDASFVPAHKPTSKHKKQLKQEIPLTPAQESQIDRDVSFSKKSGQYYHGYKNHISIDNKHKFIRKQVITTAKTHDSQPIEELINEKMDGEFYADSAYKSAKIEEILEGKKLTSKVNERAYKNKPLTDQQKKNNREKSKVRARVEHVFGHLKNSMGGAIIHTIGIARANVKITLKNIAYNMQRLAYLQNRKIA